MFVTVLPRADKTYYCSPKMSEQGKTLTFVTVLERVFNILSGEEIFLKAHSHYLRFPLKTAAASCISAEIENFLSLR